MEPLRYEYEPILGNKHIRLLTLLPGTDDDPLSGSLDPVCLDDNPHYEAISYVWGPLVHHGDFVCSGKALSLTRSLENALRRVRSKTEPKLIWADQICINQQNVVERSQQVVYMNRIYKGAARVLVWLGNDARGSASAAFKFVRDLSQLFQEHERNLATVESKTRDLEDIPEWKWSPLRKLFDQQWFARMWIVQEVGTLAPATLYWGTESLDWQLLVQVCDILSEQHHPLCGRLNVRVGKVTYLYRRFVETGNANRKQFLYELHRARGLQATDPRDHVFALLGHYSAKGDDGLPIIESNYAKPLLEIYHELAVRTLLEGKTLMTLNAVQHQQTISSTEIPTWVPRWHTGVIYMLGPSETIYAAAANSLPDLRFSPSHKTLFAKGIIIDTVRTCSEILRKKSFLLDFRQIPDHNHPVRKLWFSDCGVDGDFNLSTRYVSTSASTVPKSPKQDIEESAALAYFQTLAAGCLQTATRLDDLMTYADFPPRKWLADAAAYVLRTFRDSVHVTDDFRQVAEEGDAISWRRSVISACHGRKFVKTEKGYFGLAPHLVQEGDVVVIVYGGTTPYYLRRVIPLASGDEEKYLFLGEGYVHGFMHGEAIKHLEQGRLREQTFALQ